ncbi:MAG: hypothetical protein FWG99_11635 [Treponema sp.]|nr:hypothetical protein [Treponema sp.]
MKKKHEPKSIPALAVFIVLLLLAGFAAITQESDESWPIRGDDLSLFDTDALEETPKREPPGFIKPAEWYRSNAGGMALEAISSRLVALREKYALVIDFVEAEELPEYLLPFYDENYYIEIRSLYSDGEETRRQWIFRDYDGQNVLVAAFNQGVREAENEEALGEETFDEELTDEITEAEEEKPSITGFIEIYNENRLIVEEYHFLDDGGKRITYYIYNNGTVISAVTWYEEPGRDMANSTIDLEIPDEEIYEEEIAGGKITDEEPLLAEALTEETTIESDGFLVKLYTDNYRYNRSGFLRAIERVYHENLRLDENDPVWVAFPNNILSAAKEAGFIQKKPGIYFEFFGNLNIAENYRIIYNTDERGRVLSQALYDEDDEVVWVISNIWSGDRITSSVKEEGDVRLSIEFEYGDDGSRIVERNLRNGILERVVFTMGNSEIEELYMDDQIILRAVWEEGRKISEVRTGNR